MEKLKFNPSNKKYYSEEFIKGFECGVERQFNADMADKTAEWKKISPAGIYECTKCGQNVMTSDISAYKFCHGCGRRMKGM